MSPTCSKSNFEQAQSEYEFTESDYKNIAEVAHKKFGLHLPKSKKQLVYSRLARRLRKLQLASFREYILFIRTNPDEMSSLLSALTTNVTQFYREKHHFEIFQSRLLPSLILKTKAGGPVRIWSAGCSTGQEPYSIALCILEAFPNAKDYDIKILATDIDPMVIHTAKQAAYPIEDFSGIPSHLCKQYSEKQPSGQMAMMNQEVRDLVHFGELNLIEPFPFPRPFDAIFCRNVAIYFDQSTQKKIWAKFDTVLSAGGLLFLGHSERLSGPSYSKMTSVGTTTYKKTDH
jgi:chemotaxis protein methyltransferase CheR